MDHILQDILIDYSTDCVFQFALACADCGEVWKSEPIPFSKANEVPTSESKQIIYRTLYERGKASAREKALKEARQHFNYCPICKHIVCNNCFLICEDLDMCSNCAERLGEKGEPVAVKAGGF